MISNQINRFALFPLFFLFMLVKSGCSVLEQATSGLNTDPTNEEIASGLKEALIFGIGNGADRAAKPNGYFQNPLIKILWPPEARRVEQALRTAGMNKLCDDVILSVNRAAEDAAKEAKPIFVNAIKQLTFQDVRQILFGPQNAATTFLAGKTTPELRQKFAPAINQSLSKTGATAYWGQAMTAYNKLPLVQPVTTDLGAYVTERALDGLFKLVEEEERLIRENPIKRTTQILKKVFGYYDREKK